MQTPMSQKAVVVVPYDSAWPDQFEQVRRTLWSVVQDVAISIQHVGSTSVPRLAAKPVIDIDIVVPDDNVALAISRLLTLGYHHRGDLGVPGREAFRAPASSIAHHLYVCGVSSPALANHLAIRDYLRANIDAVGDYAALKFALALTFPNDMDGYIEGKTNFLLGILRSLGFDASALDQIDRMNRRAPSPDTTPGDTR